MKIDWSKFRARTTFVVGPDKNVGKTTFLNLALKRVRGLGYRPAYLSVGVDGESFDQITGARKPSIVAAPRDFLATAESALERSPVSLSVIRTFPARTVLGRLVLGKVERGGALELIGPETNRQLTAILASIGSETDSDATFVDGAANRVTPVSVASDACFVYTVIVRQANVQRVARELLRLSRLDRLPVLNTAPPAAATVLNGALTSGKLAAIMAAHGPVVVEDFTKVFLTGPELAGLCRARELFVRRRYELLFVIVHLEDVNRATLAGELADDPLVDRLILTSEL